MHNAVSNSGFFVSNCRYFPFWWKEALPNALEPTLCDKASSGRSQLARLQWDNAPHEDNASGRRAFP